jgi:hypothetical protein
MGIHDLIWIHEKKVYQNPSKKWTPPNNSARIWSVSQEDKSGKEILSFIRGTDPDINAKRVKRRLVPMQEQY